jgi:outer membrane immunogenic protein
MRVDLKTTVIGLALMSGFAFASPVEAADLPRGGSNYASPIMATNWAGLYAGLHVGYGVGKARNASLSGFLSGVHGGFNLQTNQIVYGLEGDINYSGVDYHGFADAFRQKWTGSLRARVGYAYDRFMPFLTGGVGFTNAAMKSGGIKADNTHLGLVVGGGVEAMLTDKISVSAQYLYHHDGAKTYVVLPLARNTNMSTNEVRIGFNYRF